MTEYVLGFAFSHDASIKGRVLLIRKIRPDWQAGLLNGIGGKIESGETPSDAMVREFAEEAGVPTQRDGWRAIGTMHDAHGEVKVHLFATRDSVAYYDAHTRTEEPIVSVAVDELGREMDLLRDRTSGRDSDIIPNLAWLVPFARQAVLSTTPLWIEHVF